jgi:hypothetical protein
VCLVPSCSVEGKWSQQIFCAMKLSHRLSHAFVICRKRKAVTANFLRHGTFPQTKPLGGCGILSLSISSIPFSHSLLPFPSPIPGSCLNLLWSNRKWRCTFSQTKLWRRSSTQRFSCPCQTASDHRFNPLLGPAGMINHPSSAVEICD